ncbi:MAG: ComEC/Rec2 family competence protein [Candidatus Auribacterota bacterium]|jgi:ComEC/Rec2-related protein|nr:ComEC/Rec2 family competence protein [Candidatus Auribacterota bacterium]
MTANTTQINQQARALAPFMESGEPVTFEGRVLGFPTVQALTDPLKNKSYSRVKFYCKARPIIPVTGIYTKLLVDIICTNQVPKIGDTIRFSAPVSYPPAFRLNRWHTYRDYLLTRNVVIIAKNKSASDVSVINRHIFFLLLSELRDSCLSNLESGIQETGEAELIKAMLFGISPQIERYILDRFAQLGIIHIIVVSGLHVACLSFFWMTLLQLFGIRRSTACAIIIPILLIYLFLAGFKVPILRAVLMIIFYFSADFFKRERNPFHACMLAGFLQLLVMPRLIFDQGFHYSFLALFGLLCIYPVLREPIKKISLYKIVSYPLLTLSVWIPVAPMMAFRLGIFLPIGFILGSILIFVVQIMLDIGMFSALLGFISHDLSTLLNYSNFILAKLIFISVQSGYERFDIHFYIQQLSALWLILYFSTLISIIVYVKNTEWKIIGILAAFSGIMAFAVSR